VLFEIIKYKNNLRSNCHTRSTNL